MSALVGAAWLHAIAIVVLMGYYTTLSLVVLPWLASGGSPEPGRVLAALERRARPWVLASVVLFTLTGVVLITAHRDPDPHWTTWIILKHLVVVAIVALGVAMDRVLVPRLDGTWWTPPVEASTDPRDLRPVAQTSALVALLGAVVLLLTAIARG